MNLGLEAVLPMVYGMVAGGALGWVVLTWLRTERKVKPTKRKEHSMFARFRELAPGYTVGEENAGRAGHTITLHHGGKRVGEGSYVNVYGLRHCYRKVRRMSWQRHKMRLDGQTKPAPKPAPEFKAVTLRTTVQAREESARERFYGTPPAYDFTHTQPITTDKED